MSEGHDGKIYSAIQAVSADALINAVLGETEDQFRATLEGTLFSFSVAVVAAFRGFTVARASWKNPGKYVWLEAGDEIADPATGETVPMKPYLAWKNDKGEFVPWVPSQDAMLTADWFIGESGGWGKVEPSTARTGRPPASEPIQN